VSEHHPGAVAPLDEPGDAELISAVRAGDPAAYGVLFERHAEAARRLARQLVSAADVDDLVSEAFAKVLAVLQRGGGPDLAFRAYLLTSVRRLHVDRLRSTSRLQTTDDLTPYDPGVPFEDTAVAEFENATAAKAFASLPERWQQVLWHTEVEGQRPAEIAPLLGITPNSVSALAYRAREGLRQAFVTMHAQDVVDDDCSPARAQLGSYLRGGLSRRDCAKVEAHLQDCRPCTAIYLELSDVNADLGAVLAPLLLGGAGAGYLAAAHVGAVAAAKGGTLLLLDRGKDWLLHNPVGRATGGVAAATIVAVAVAGGVGLASAPQKPTAAADGHSSAPPAPAQPSGRETSTVPPSHKAGVGRPSAAPLSTPAPLAVAGSIAGSATGATTGSITGPITGSITGVGAAAGSADVGPTITHPLTPVSLAPGARSATIDLVSGASDTQLSTLRLKSARIAGRPAHGTVRIVGTSARAAVSRASVGAPLRARRLPRSVKYTPEPSWRGTETIVYVLADARGRTVTGTVDVTTPNRVPVAAADRTTVHVGKSGQPVNIPVLDNDSDPNDDRLKVISVTAVSGPLGGDAAVVPDGEQVTYRPGITDAVPGVASFRYTVSDGHGGTATAPVTVIYGNSAPVAVDDAATTPSTGDRSVLVDVLTNDSDPDGDTLTATLQTDAAHGTVVREGDGFRYTPQDAFDGTDSFSYTLTDPYGASSTATVTVTAVTPQSAFVLVDGHVGQTTDYLYSRPTVSGIPRGRHATATVTVHGFEEWSSNEIALPDACGSWSTDGTTLTLVCHLGADDNGRQLGHFDAYASAIVLSTTADDFDAPDAELTLAPRQ